MVQLKEVEVNIPKAKKLSEPEFIDGNCEECNCIKSVTRCNDRVFRCAECRDKYIIKKREMKIAQVVPPKFLNIETNKPQFDKYKDNPQSLFVWGKCGTGKTVFACSLAKAYITSGIRVRFISYPAFIMQIQSQFKSEGGSPYSLAEEAALFPFSLMAQRSPNVVNQYTGDGVLIIDDLGAEKLTDFCRQITYYILNERELYLRKTIITSNFSLAEIDAQIDPRVSSRIEGMSDKILHFTGSDLRLKNRKE